MKIRSALCFGGLLALSSGANAQGYFSFDDIPGLDSEPTVEIDLGPDMMRFFGEAAKEAAADTTGLEGITNVRVRVYEGIGDSQAELLKFVEDTSRTLEGSGWRSVIRVNEGGERVRIFMKPAASGASSGSIEGITLMVVDTGGGDEAVFINVAGIIQPEQLGRIASGIGMDGMFNMMPGFPGPAPRAAPQATQD
jgi:hypothetical protein